MLANRNGISIAKSETRHHVAILVITPLVVSFGFAASLAAKRAWPAALIWMVVAILLSYGER
jgi:hypothetical protein